MVHPASEIDRYFRSGLDTYPTIGDIAIRFINKDRKQFPSLWLALPTNSAEDLYARNMFAFIYLEKPTMAQIASKIQGFYDFYIDLSSSTYNNGPMGRRVYVEGAANGDNFGTELESAGPVGETGQSYNPIVIIKIGS